MSSPNENPFAAPEVEQYRVASPAGPEFNTPELRQVGLGLKFVYLGIVSMIAGGMIAGVGIVMAEGLLQFGWTAITGFGLILVGYILTTIGPLLCLATPEESQGKGLIISSVIFHLVNVGITIFTFLELLSAWQYLDLVSSIAAILSWILFMLYLRRLALYIRHQQFAARATAILAGAITLSLIYIVYAYFLWNAVAVLRPPAWVPIIGMGLAIAALVLFVSYANLVNRMSKLLRP